jgi:hypothetical protein
MIHHGQGIAPATIAGLELSLVVGAPQLIGLCGGLQDVLNTFDTADPSLGFDLPGTLQDVVDGGLRWNEFSIEPACQQGLYLLRPRRPLSIIP